MNKINILIIYFISALFVFLLLSTHFFSPYKEKNSYYDYSYIIRYLNDRVNELPYGNNEYCMERYKDLKRTIDRTTKDIELSYIDLENDYKDNIYTLEEYHTRKTDFDYYLEKLEETALLLEDKVK